MTTITPEQFMAQPPEPDEEETPALAPSPDTLVLLPPDPLTSIAQSLGRLVGVVESRDFDAGLADSVREDLLDLEAKHEVLYALLEEIETIIKPSTSKLANQVRDAITAWRNPEVPTAEPDAATEAGTERTEPGGEPADRWEGLTHPDHNAHVEEWRAFARTRTDQDVTGLNRSQIRSVLGIEQPGTPVAPSVVHS